MWFSYRSDPGVFIPMHVAIVHGILEANQKGEIPEALIPTLKAVEKILNVEPNFENLVGQDSLTRFDRKGGKPRNQRQGKPQSKQQGGRIDKPKGQQPNKQQSRPQGRSPQNPQNKPANKGQNQRNNQPRKPNPPRNDNNDQKS